jgi:hypothetical protein
MRKVILAVILLLAFGKLAIGQKQIEVREQTWLAYFNQTRFTEKSGLWLDVHHRLTGDFFNKPSITIVRFGYIYYITDHVRLGVGDTFAKQYSDVGPDVPEHRPWQQIQWTEKKSKLTVSQRLRVEQRFRRNVLDGDLTDSYNFNWRFRYNLQLTFPLRGEAISPSTPFAVFNNELHINAGKNINYNYFDQNRLFVGVGFQFTKSTNAQLGYNYVFQQLPAGNEFLHINAIRLFVYQTIDLHSEE